MKRAIWSLGLFAALALGTCGRAPVLGPPKIAFGQDACSHCDMIVSDERFAAAIVDRAGNEDRPLLFDDIGCLLKYESEHPQGGGRRYFHDFASHQWITEREPVFAKTESHSPMGSGIAAFGSVDEARKALPGVTRIFSFPELAGTPASENDGSKNLSTR